MYMLLESKQAKHAWYDTYCIFTLARVESRAGYVAGRRSPMNEIAETHL
jgi:hypothetical protein